MKICVYGASSNTIDPEYLQAGEELGLALAKRGHGLVFGGGQKGMMGAVARGTARGGGEIIGVSPHFFDVEGVLYPHCTELIFTETMRQRKAIMEQRADAFLMTPGGIGTFEEFFEVLTLRQLGRHQKPIAVLNTGNYYGPLLEMLEQAIAQNFMRPECRALYAFFDTPEAALDYLETAPAAPPDPTKLRDTLPVGV